MTPTRRSLLKAAAVSPVLLSPTLLSACAGGSTSAEGTLNVGQISNSVAFFPLFIAEERGFFSDEDLELGDRPRLGTGAKVAAALKSGSIDLGAGVMTDAFNLRSIDDGGRLTTSLVSEYYVDIIAGSELAGAKGPSLEDQIGALEGTKIGITGPGSGTEALVTYLLGLVDLDSASDVELVNLGSESSAAIGALKSGQVDALSFFQPIGQQAEAEGVGTIFISPARGDVPDLDGALHGVVFGREEILEEKKDEVAAFNTAIGKALELIAGDEGETRELLGAYLEGTSDEVLDQLVPLLPQEVSGQVGIVEDEYEIERTFHVESGLVEDAPSYDDMVPEDFRA